jgi:hypothetical protein
MPITNLIQSWRRGFTACPARGDSRNGAVPIAAPVESDRFDPVPRGGLACRQLIEATISAARR